MKWIRDILKQRKKDHLYREFRTIASANTSQITYKRKKLLMFASNNYFGLNTHEQVVAAAKKAIDKYGAGNCSSRLIVNLDLHEKLEKEIARFKKCDAALAFSSGFVTNSVVSNLVSEGDLVISDELNHASIIDGIKMSKAEKAIYQHNNLADLEEKLLQSVHRRILVVTDSIFSMDGDMAPIHAIIALKKKYKFMLMVDDAHATGILNTNYKEVDIHMGTLSKTLGSQGGFVAGSKELIDYLRNTARAFVYSTGLSPADSAAALEALKVIQSTPSLRIQLLENASYVREKLSELGFSPTGESHIMTIEMKDNKAVMAAQKKLEKQGVFVTGIRPPTVPTPRLRISVMSTHTKQELDQLVHAFSKLTTK